MKTRWNRFLLLLLAALLVLACVSCGKGEQTGDGGASGSGAQSDDVTDPSENPERVLELVKDGKSDYVIYYPEDCSEELWGAAQRLATGFENYTGAKLQCTGDLLAPGAEPDPDALEILVGKTNRQTSADAAAGLGTDEYIICVSGNRLVICGYSDAATGAAVDYFVSAFLRGNPDLSYGKTGSLSFSSDDNYVFEIARSIQQIRIAGADISSFRLVVPEDGYLEQYIAVLLRDHIATHHGAALEIVTDAEPAAEHEIRIGKTNRTVASVDAGTYKIAVSGGALEAVSNTTSGYVEIIQELRNRIFAFSNSEVLLEAGNEWSGADQAADNIDNSSDFRILYHNVWGYLNYEKDNPVANRAELALSLYREYLPDVLCLQEAGPAFRAEAQPLMRWLSANYGEICYSDQGGSGNPIFYSRTVFELVESGYAKSRNGDKGTTWAVLRFRENGELIAVTNSHFAANSNANDNPTLGNEYRVQDAGAVVSATEAILSKYGDIPVLSGGDFNCAPGSDPYRVLTTAGYCNVRSAAAAASDISPYNGSFTDKYDAELDIYELNSLTAAPGSSQNAIDHIMVYGEPEGISLDEYDVITNRIACTASDHLPHFIDVSWN